MKHVKITEILPNFVNLLLFISLILVVVAVAATVVVIEVLLGRTAPYKYYSRDI